MGRGCYLARPSSTRSGTNRMSFGLGSTWLLYSDTACCRLSSGYLHTTNNTEASGQSLLLVSSCHVSLCNISQIYQLFS